ncbi:MAG: hypothetical protein LQ342_005091 [Letrouitia transgressa]|nr:MAG: hypothetical protein LQ342_005091 [Letrouitia transgressa]
MSSDDDNRLPDLNDRLYPPEQQHSHGGDDASTESRSTLAAPEEVALPLPPSTLPPPAPKEQDYLVDFASPLDPSHPQNWSGSRKLIIFATCSYDCFCSTFSSAVWSPATAPLSAEFGISPEVGTLTTSLFLLGYVFGPQVWGPLSELRGRRIPIVVSMVGHVLFSAGAATGKDLQTVLLCRFFAGVMGSGPLTVAPAVFGDVFNARARTAAVAGYAVCLFCGPVLAPFISGFTIMNQGLGWRFDGYWVLIMNALAAGFAIFFQYETYPAVILASKAAEIRARTGNWAIHAPHDNIQVDFRELVTKYFTRPAVMLVTEPVLFLVSFYMSFIYALIYLFFTAYPLVFEGVHHFNPGIAGLPFLALGIGVMSACVMTVVVVVPALDRKLVANNNVPLPEWRLPQVMLGGVVFTIGLFWFGWTGRNANIHWISPTLSGLVTGFGLISIFMPLFNYIIDTYLMYAASAVAANTAMRSALAAGFPMFARYMFNGLGIGLATTVLGAVAAALIPVPVAFYFFGAKLRERSKFAPTSKPMAAKKGDEEKGR